MNAPTKKTIGILLFVVISVILGFVLPGLTGLDPHIRANKEFLEGLNCEFDRDYKCATARYQNAISIYSKDSRYYTHLARVDRLQGFYNDAIQMYLLAKAVNPSDENAKSGLDKAIQEQAVQTALPLPPGTMQPTEIESPDLPESSYLIFDEDFGIIESVIVDSQSSDTHIDYQIVDDDAYSGRYSLLVSWEKSSQEWASVILAFDTPGDINRAAAGQMRSIDLSPPSDYAIQFFAKRGEASVIDAGQGLPGVLMNRSITIKFQDQNILIKESIGNQAVYKYNYDSKDAIVDGRLKLQEGDWQEFCLPLEKFATDSWITKLYPDFPESDLDFSWTNVKQINIDADYHSTQGSIYIDAMRIIRASDCTPYP